MSFVKPVVLRKNNVRLEPLTDQHIEGLKQATQDGELWKLRITSTPTPDQVEAYIQLAHTTADRFAFAVIDETTNTIVGTTSYHDILPDPKRVEIGYTWYAKSAQRTHINTTCKFLLLEHAFETLGVNTVALRTDQFNFASQKAIERIGAKKDGVIRGHACRKDGSIRDTVMYSIIQGEWTNVKAHLQDLLARG